LETMNEARCKDCRKCVPSRSAERMGFKNYWTCTEGRFDEKTPSGYVAPTAYAWRGICKPNKGVAKAQKDCPVFERKET
jgi:hypothetical protein